MSRKNGKRGRGEKSPSRLFPFTISLPERGARILWGIFFFALAVIFVFAFFSKAGTAGNFLFFASQWFLGKTVFLFPFLFVIAAFAVYVMKELRVSLLFLSLVLFVSGLSGILGTFAKANSMPVQEFAGFLGFALAFPLSQAFGFWVSILIFGAVFLGSLFLYWQILPREKEVLIPGQTSLDKVKKVFEPKFQVSPIEKALPAPVVPDSQPSQKEAISLPKTKHGELPFLGEYKLPPTNLLEDETGSPSAGDIELYSSIIKKTLGNFDIPVEVSEVNIGPTVTQYAIRPAEGVKVSRITGLSNDLALALAAHPIRIEAPIPGRALVGIEVPNRVRTQVRLRPLLEADQYKNSPASLLLSLGKDVSGAPWFADLARMPHLLVAGATGAGKTIALNSIILSLLYRNSPASVRFILVDPKRVEFPVFNDIPHLLTPVILDTQRTLNALKWLVREMERRFQVLSSFRARDIRSYQALVQQSLQKKQSSEMEQLPYIVLVVDELADLMAARGKELEALIVRLAQMSRAVGIHLVLATQRPSVEVITGLIKANITTRIALQVASQIDSRTILDAAGAEKLLGQGDLLFVSSDVTKPKRVQGAYVSDKEVKKVVAWIAKETQDFVREEIAEDELAQSALAGLEVEAIEGGDEDPLYEEAKRIVIEYQKASSSLLQRRMRIGYARAARLLDILENKGVVGPGEGAKPREVYITREGTDVVEEAYGEARPRPEQSAVEAEPQAKEAGPQEQKPTEEESRWFTP
ncbi:MAG: DNA translocase FtsK [Candidatus Wildermuthbacteria bacterium]|nr:DNA translocase FtsK [Candidatus Wildermuthbacteria bacterium]